MPLAVDFPKWTPHPDVWLIVGLLAAGYAIAIVRLGPRLAPGDRAVVTRFQVTCWSLGVFATWLASDWPIHDIAERYNYSIHMVQHLTFAMVVAPLLLLGTPAWLLRWVLSPPRLLHAVRTLRAVRARAARVQPRARAHALAVHGEREPALGRSCTSRCTRCCSSRRSSCGSRS